MTQAGLCESRSRPLEIRGQQAAGHGHCALRRWIDVLIHAEEVGRIVLLLDRCQPR